jgi:hypothetical protein
MQLSLISTRVTGALACSPLLLATSQLMKFSSIPASGGACASFSSSMATIRTVNRRRGRERGRNSKFEIRNSKGLARKGAVFRIGRMDLTFGGAIRDMGRSEIGFEFRI